MPKPITTRTRIADLGKPRIIVIGRGFAGLEFIKRIDGRKFQTVLFDRFNHHTFQPSLYQMATRGLETHSIIFLFRKEFWSKPDFFCRLGRTVKSYYGHAVRLTAFEKLITRTLIWAAGVKGHPIPEPATGAIGKSGCTIVDACCPVKGHENIFAIGDIARMEGDPNFNAGHPQMAPTAIRQGRQFARNFSRWLSKQGPLPFRYLRIGSMAAVGRNHALVDRVFVFFSWLWGNFSYDQSNRIIISRSCEGI
jgi:NADH dehydrogenase FAD-containing subunit